MAQNVYECLFLFDANKYARDPAGVSGAVPKMVNDVDGEILADRLWNEQRLAYQVNGQRKGTYWLTYFRMDSSRLAEFDRACRLNETIHRHLVIKVDPRLVDVLVSHAQGKTADTEEAETTETAAAST